MQTQVLQKYASQDYNGLVTKHHLGTLYQKKPMLIDNVIREIYKTYLQDDMVNFVDQFPVKYVEEDTYYEWMLQGQHDKNVPLVDCYDANGDAVGTGNFLEPGKNISRFYMVFAEAYFEPTNVILGHKEPYHLLIQNMRPKGQLFEYEVELVTSDQNLFVPIEELQAGTRWSKDYNLVPSTLSSRGASPNFTSPFRMRNTISQMRMEYKVPGNMIRTGQNYALEFPFKVNGKDEKVWINYQDMVADMQFRQQYARMLLYGKKNWDLTNDLVFNKDEQSKFEIKSGAGLFEQIDPSNIHYYNQFDLDYMIGVLIDMGVGRIERGKRMITLGTGEFGAMQFHLAVQAQTTKWTPNFYQERIYKTDTGGLGIMGLGYGGQFVEYTSVNGVGIRLQIIPFFDDIVRFKDYHPSGQGTTESYRYIALDYGGDAGIYRVRPKDQPPIMRHIPGLRDPYSPGGAAATQGMAVSAIDGYEVHRMDWGGMMVTDPTKIVDFRLNMV